MFLRQLYLYIIFVVSMGFSGYGEMSAASISLNDSCPASSDRIQKIEHKHQMPDAQLEDASVAAYRVCSSRPQRLLPTGNIHSSGGNADNSSRLLFNRIRVLSSLLSTVFGGTEPFRLESAPIHFDVASKYYVICLRHLLC